MGTCIYFFKLVSLNNNVLVLFFSELLEMYAKCTDSYSVVLAQNEYLIRNSTLTIQKKEFPSLDEEDMPEAHE